MTKLIDAELIIEELEKIIQLVKDADGVKVVPLVENALWNERQEALDMAIEALDERKIELFDDGTLVVNVKEGEKVGRVLIDGDDNFGGLYYPDSGEREES